jgi:multidrug efflux pump subunit AcrB
MNISEPFIRRPVATALLMAALFVGGAIGYSLLPVAALPTVDFPTLQVTATLPGASPEIIAASVAQPFERQFADLPRGQPDHLDERPGHNGHLAAI